MDSQLTAGDPAASAAGDDQQISRTSVGDLVKQINDAPAQLADGRDKRGRSESGDALPAGKRGVYRRGELGRSPGQCTESVKERVEIMLQDFESRIVGNISRDLHELRDVIQAQLDSFEARIKELESHVEEKDNEVESLRKELGDVKQEMTRLQGRAEDAEINSRLPCLILSGDALAPDRGRPGRAPGAAGLPGRGPGSSSAVASTAPGGGGSRSAGGDGPATSADRQPAGSQLISRRLLLRRLPGLARAGAGTGAAPAGGEVRWRTSATWW